jgi:hypothetical protein
MSIMRQVANDRGTSTSLYLILPWQSPPIKQTRLVKHKTP